MDNKNGFILFHEYYEHFKLLSNDELGELVRAIFEYEISGEICSELNPMQKMAFSFIKKDLDNNREKYNAKAEANKANGSKGGRPAKEKTEQNPNNPTVISETEQNPTEPKKADKDKDSDKDKDKDSESTDTPDGDTPAQKESDEKRLYGGYGWVRLSDAEYQRLVSEYNQDMIDWYIACVDRKAQTTKNKNKWKDWNLVIRNAIRDKWDGGYVPAQKESSGWEGYKT